jgi:hypothetical protein
LGFLQGLENLPLEVIGISNSSPIIDFHGRAMDQFIAFHIGGKRTMRRYVLGKEKVFEFILELP